MVFTQNFIVVPKVLYWHPKFYTGTQSLYWYPKFYTGTQSFNSVYEIRVEPGSRVDNTTPWPSERKREWFHTSRHQGNNLYKSSLKPALKPSDHHACFILNCAPY